MAKIIQVSLSGGDLGGTVVDVEVGTWPLGDEREFEGYVYVRSSANQAVLARAIEPAPTEI